MKISELAVNE